VPLATFTVSGGPCRVVKVCNWTPLRPIVVTFPNLLHWLSAVPQAALLRERLHALCCGPAPNLSPRLGLVAGGGPLEQMLGSLLQSGQLDIGQLLKLLGIASLP
jgi:hypothetical protein